MSVTKDERKEETGIMEDDDDDDYPEAAYFRCSITVNEKCCIEDYYAIEFMDLKVEKSSDDNLFPFCPRSNFTLIRRHRSNGCRLNSDNSYGHCKRFQMYVCEERYIALSFGCFFRLLNNVDTVRNFFKRHLGPSARIEVEYVDGVFDN